MVTTQYSETIKDKVFKKDDIMILLGLVAKNIKPKKKGDFLSSDYFDVSLKAHDGLSYQFDEFNEGELEAVLKTKRIEQISITYRERNDDSTISCKLDVSRYGLNYFNIEAKNKDWFNARKSELKDFFKDVENQNNFYTRYRGVIATAVAVYIGYFIILVVLAIVDLIYNVSHVQIKPADHNSSTYKILTTLNYPIILVGSYFTGLLPTDILKQKVDALWPSIEFNFGPAHLNSAQRNRKILAYVISVIIIPFIIGLAITLLIH